MEKIKTLCLYGGKIHDFKACGAGITAALKACPEFDLTIVEDNLDALVAPKLDPYDLIVFYYTIGDINDAQKNGLLNWVASGKGYVGIHSAADSFRGCPEYRAMVGGYFLTHPKYRQYQVSVVDPQHPITKDLVEFMVTDEQYIVSYDKRNHILATALHKGEAVPVAWTKEWGTGRVFWLALGHNGDSCKDPNFALLLQRGAKWAATPPPQKEEKK
ncbi:MAG: ThuA domain-containing protein [Planctomycetota bacterium]